MPSTRTTSISFYSPSERDVLSLLQKQGGKPLDTLALVKKYYGRGELPYNARQIVSGLLRSLKQKAAHNKEKWRVHSSARRGPHPIEWWVE